MAVFGLFLIFSVVAIQEGHGSGSRLTLARTTVMGGLLVKRFSTKGPECVDLPFIWHESYPRWGMDIEGKCIALFKYNNCTGEPSKILLDRKPAFGEYLVRIPISSFRECINGEAETELNAPRPYQRVKLTRVSPPPDTRTDMAAVQRQGKIINWNDTNVVLKVGRPASALATFYSRPGYQGSSYTGRITGRCTPLPARSTQLGISSVSSPSECVRIYEQLNCQGRSIQVQAGDEYAKNLAHLDFDKRIKSYGPCEEFQKLGLLMHNYYRGLHGSPPLKTKESLNLAAQLMAEYLASQPALPKPIGFISAELFYATNDGPSDRRLLVRDAIQSWYKEGENYDWNNPIASRFTQLIWKNMRDFGIGTARVGNRAVVVANYFPRANFAGQFQENVRPRLY